RVLRVLIEKQAKLFTIDANRVARESGMGSRINTIMQVAFFALANVMPPEQSLEAIRKAIKKTYGVKGEAIVQKNLAAVDQTLANLHEVPLPSPAITDASDADPVILSRPFVANAPQDRLRAAKDPLPETDDPAAANATFHS